MRMNQCRTGQEVNNPRDRHKGDERKSNNGGKAQRSFSECGGPVGIMWKDEEEFDFFGWWVCFLAGRVTGKERTGSYGVSIMTWCRMNCVHLT
mmetsp:Transcript_3092/g.6915  ORF Transcript_3092/g.6915 Transcript_3092/m.6915 type:complete len:93 (-) Transcript_3092:1801-2079(-)